MEGMSKQRHNTPTWEVWGGTREPAFLRDSKWSWWTEGHTGWYPSRQGPTQALAAGSPPTASRKAANGICCNQLAGVQTSSVMSESLWLCPYSPGDKAQWLHLKKRNNSSPLSGDLWGLKEIFAQKYDLTKSIIQVSLIRRMCQSQQKNPRWVFCLLPLLSLYESTFW